MACFCPEDLVAYLRPFYLKAALPVADAVENCCIS